MNYEIGKNKVTIVDGKQEFSVLKGELQKFRKLVDEMMMKVSLTGYSKGLRNERSNENTTSNQDGVAGEQNKE